MVDSEPGRGSESPWESGGADIRRVVLQFRHEILTSFLCEDEARYESCGERHSVIREGETDILTGQSLSSQVSGERHSSCISYVSQKDPCKARHIRHDFEPYRNKQTHNFTTVFWPMAFIELTYALDKYAGVASGNSAVCFPFPFGSDGAIVCVLGCVVRVALSLVTERDDK